MPPPPAARRRAPPRPSARRGAPPRASCNAKPSPTQAREADRRNQLPNGDALKLRERAKIGHAVIIGVNTDQRMAQAAWNTATLMRNQGLNVRSLAEHESGAADKVAAYVAAGGAALLCASGSRFYETVTRAHVANLSTPDAITYLNKTLDLGLEQLWPLLPDAVQLHVETETATAPCAFYGLFDVTGHQKVFLNTLIEEQGVCGHTGEPITYVCVVTAPGADTQKSALDGGYAVAWQLTKEHLASITPSNGADGDDGDDGNDGNDGNDGAADGNDGNDGKDADDADDADGV